MTNPILTPTVYSALCNLLEWSWTSLLQEPELLLKDINYYHPDKPDDYDPVMGGECGLGMSEAFEYTLDQPDRDNIMLMIKTLMYKLNANTILADGLGNSWETLAPLVDNDECSRLDDLDDDPDVTYQTLENYVLEDTAKKNKVARLQEHFDNVNESGFIQIGDNMWIDGANSDIL